MTTPHPLSGLRPDRATIAAMLSLAQALQPVATEAIKATQTKETTNVSRTAR
jgi:hypothetical protein